MVVDSQLLAGPQSSLGRGSETYEPEAVTITVQTPRRPGRKTVVRSSRVDASGHPSTILDNQKQPTFDMETEKGAKQAREGERGENAEN